MTNDLFQLVYEILQEHAPEEREVFSIVGKDMIGARLNPASSASRDPRQFGLGVQVETGLLMVHLVAGTLAVIEAYLSARRINEESKIKQELQKVWEERLIAHNVPPTIARLASQQRMADLVHILDLTQSKEWTEK